MTQIIAALNRSGDLNMKVKRACEAFVAGKGTFNQCLVSAGYSSSSASNSWKALQEIPEVKAYIAELESKVQVEAVASKEDILMFWTQMMADTDQKGSDRISASKLLAQHYGLMDTGNKDVKEKDPFVIDIMPKKLLPKVMEVVDER